MHIHTSTPFTFTAYPVTLPLVLLGMSHARVTELLVVGVDVAMRRLPTGPGTSSKSVMERMVDSSLP